MGTAAASSTSKAAKLAEPGVWISVGLAVLVLILVISSQGGGGQQTEPVVVEVVAPPDLCWSGAFGDRTVDGCGNQTVPLEDTAGVYAANAQKQDDSSVELVLVLTADGRVLDTTSTSAAYGMASVSGKP